MVKSGHVAQRFVSYLRVSTQKQGASGLGEEAQRAAVAQHVASVGGRLVTELKEVESGRKADRPKLAEALAACRKHRAVLIIAKLDRLSRDAHFLLGLDKAGVEFVAVDMPNANRLTVGIMALVAEEEAKMISARTKAALAAAKARGKKLGGYRANSGDIRPHAAKGAAASVAVRIKKADDRATDLAPIVRELQANGASLRAIAAELTARGIRTARNGTWTAVQVSRILQREAAAE
jgi:DNA invertase Pin-like site-specific DNA recombinase